MKKTILKDSYSTTRKKPKKYGALKAILTKATLEDLYFTHEMSLQEIANEFGCTRWYVQYLMKKNGLQRRNKSKARILGIKKGKFKDFEYHLINEKFFREWSPAMAWVLGLLFTDGHITKGTVTASSVDLELLTKIKLLLGSTKSIDKRAQSYDKSKFIYCFQFHRQNMREDLHKLGLVSRKSHILKFPDIPDEYIRHFIRGCWDGDGSIYITGGRLEADYVSGSRNFIERLVKELYKIGIYRKNLQFRYAYRKSFKEIQKFKNEWKKLRDIYPPHKYPLAIHKKHNAKAFNIKIRTKEDMNKLFHFLYDGVDGSMYLIRKYKVFLRGLGLLHS
jgi:hypothetical protein